ncbi:hypothetical protein [Lacinutrix undariae]
MTTKQKGLFYKIIFIFGLIAMIWQIHIYRQTVIPFIIPISIVLIMGLLTTFLALNDFQKLFNYSRKMSLYFWAFIQSAVSWGFLACALFMLTNYYMAPAEAHKQTYKIIDRSSLPGRKHYRHERKPTFKINHNGQLKELVFAHKYYPKKDFYQSIDLTVKKGFLGYDILVEQNLK